MRGVKLLTGAAAAVLLMGYLGPTPVLADTIEAALVRAYQNNPQLNAQRAQVRVTDENVPQALSGYRPKVALTASADKTAAAHALVLNRTVVASPKPLRAILATPDSARVVVAGDDGIVHVLNASSGAEERKVGEPTQAVNAIALSKNAQVFATAGADKSIRLFTFNDGKEVGTYAATDLAAGVNLGNLDSGPLFDQGQQVFKAITDKNTMVHDRFRGVVMYQPPGWLGLSPEQLEEKRTAELAKRCDVRLQRSGAVGGGHRCAAYTTDAVGGSVSPTPYAGRRSMSAPQAASFCSIG